MVYGYLYVRRINVIYIYIYIYIYIHTYIHTSIYVNNAFVWKLLLVKSICPKCVSVQRCCIQYLFSHRARRLNFHVVCNVFIYGFLYQWSHNKNPFVYTYIYRIASKQASTFVRTYVCTYVRKYGHTYLYTYVRIYVRICVHIYIYIYMCVCVRTYVLTSVYLCYLRTGIY